LVNKDIDYYQPSPLKSAFGGDSLFIILFIPITAGNNYFCTAINQRMLTNETNPRQAAIQTMNRYGKELRPFLFIVDFLEQKPVVIPLEEVERDTILYQTPLSANCVAKNTPSDIHIEPYPLSKVDYVRQFEAVVHEIRRGNSFVTNLTCATPIVCNANLRDIFHASAAKYKLWYHDEFVCFSPETFVRIEDGEIITCPMKGTIDAAFPDAAQTILNNEKEKAEHNCVVDLLRNDISRVADQVEVTRYRYIDEIQTEKGSLLQVSSEIRGQLADDYHEHLGDTIFSMLPAGSITGAPKVKTTEIIRRTESYERGYYTGVFGLFDGRSLDSSVMIRFIENTHKGLIYKSGGGITAKSNMDDEYNEMIEKIYVPLIRKY
jgi:para-aminobenzoate synthetase component 1